ncbi:MAG: cell envelope integrity protein TolA [Ruminococcus sp.]|nr:cell envelope integrity protein TolA [Ruminococcus sp.]
MDSKVEENYKRLREELNERLNNDRRLTAIMDKISKGTATFKDSAEYSQIVADHMGDVISKNIGNIKIPMGKEMVCKELLRDHYDLINGVFGDVQVSVDEKMGIHIKPVKPAYPTERVDSWAHSLEDPTVEQSVIERRAASGSENIGNSMHDNCIEENAKLHDKAGLDTYLVRDAGGGCCAWCAAIAGRYRYADAPDDVFRRHDNCTCTVTYECGRKRQDVWSKKTWETSDKDLQERIAASEAARPMVKTPAEAQALNEQSKSNITVLSKEQAEALNEQNKPTVFTEAEAKEREAKALGKDNNVNIEFVDKSEESGIINNKEQPITTIEQASDYLNSVFASVENNVLSLNEKLIIDNTEQLRKLNSKFGVLNNDNTGYISGSRVKALAETYNDPSSSRNDLILSSTYFSSENNLVTTERIMQDRFYSMPISEDYMRVATITHEYGHMLENEIIRSRISQDAFDKYQAALERGERKSVALTSLRSEEKTQAKAIFNEIVEIAKENNPDFVLKDNLSTYGHKNHFEFFAECFMNSQCGKPNELGKAMLTFLERSGY